MPVDDLEQRPGRPLGQPRVAVGVDPRGGGHGVAEQPLREGEVDVGAHPVGAARRGAEDRGNALGQPALHPARGHGYHLGGKRVGRAAGEQLGQGVGEGVGSV